MITEILVGILIGVIGTTCFYMATLPLILKAILKKNLKKAGLGDILDNVWGGKKDEPPKVGTN